MKVKHTRYSNSNVSIYSIQEMLLMQYKTWKADPDQFVILTRSYMEIRLTYSMINDYSIRQYMLNNNPTYNQ